MGKFTREAEGDQEQSSNISSGMHELALRCVSQSKTSIMLLICTLCDVPKASVWATWQWNKFLKKKKKKKLVKSQIFQTKALNEEILGYQLSRQSVFNVNEGEAFDGARISICPEEDGGIWSHRKHGLL